MINIFVLLQCLDCLDKTTFKRLVLIVLGLLSMTGRVTMLGISRWAGKGGSYSTVIRFFDTMIDWGKIQWILIKNYIFDSNDTYLLAGDEVVVTKAGKSSYGLDKFFSSLIGKPVQGLCFFVVSLISVGKRKSYPLYSEQVIRSHTEQESKSEKKKPKKRGRGRPKGSKNKNRKDVKLSSHMVFIQKIILVVLALMGINVSYMLLDGAFGNNYALQMVQQCGLELICKLRYNSALYFPYQGNQKKRGRKRKYGDRINYSSIPEKYLKETTIVDSIQTKIYQMEMLHKLFPELLNIVIIVKTNLQTGATAHVVFFTSDMNLSYEKIIDYYALRFQIEFNFRDAKQYWGLEDFMTTKKKHIDNSVNLSLFMVNLSHILIDKSKDKNIDCSVIDLKARYTAIKYTDEILKLLPKKPEPILIQEIYKQISTLGAVNTGIYKNNYP